MVGHHDGNLGLAVLVVDRAAQMIIDKGYPLSSSDHYILWSAVFR